MGEDGMEPGTGWTAESIRLRTGRLGWGPQELARELREAARPDLDRKLPARASVERTIRLHMAGTASPRSLYGELYRRVFTAHGVLDLPLETSLDAGGDWNQVSALLRRTFMKQGIAMTALPALGRDQGQRVLQALEVMSHGHPGAVADSLGELVEHYALTICTMPPANTYDELLIVRAYANEVLDSNNVTPQYRNLALAAGWLSHLLAVAACDMGERAAARIWCADAERRSQDVGHPELAAWAVLTRSMITFYQGQPRHSATLASRGQQIAPIGTVVHAKLASQEMRAAAMVGDADRMISARRYAATAIAKLPSEAAGLTGAFSIALADDPPYTATSLMLLGRFNEAVSATNCVIQTVYQPEARQRGEHPSGYARSLLILGLAQAGGGDLDGAVSAGRAALDGSRPAWPTMVLASKLDQVLGRDFAGARATAEYHARYLEAAGAAGQYRQPSDPSQGS
jgi:hypothetical protein